MRERPTSQDAGEAAFRLAKKAQSGALATVRRAKEDATGHPYVSKVAVCLDADGSPLFLFSTLAAHTQDLLADKRASVLFEAPQHTENPLESERTTMVGTVDRLDFGSDQRARERYLVHHPSAAQYIDFGDFALWRMTVEKVQYVGGFGLAKWIKGSEYYHQPR